MDQKAIGILLVIGAVILFANSVRERRQGHASFSTGQSEGLEQTHLRPAQAETEAYGIVNLGGGVGGNAAR